MLIKKDCEQQHRYYLCLFGKRFIFNKFKYEGWYKP